MVASSVRIPKELYSFIEELADHLLLSRQEMMLKLLEEGASIAQDEINQNETDEEVSSNYHLLNTNKRHDIEYHEKMIKDGIAAAFYDPWKLNISRIRNGDVVFLYENGVGIVAYGKGTGDTIKTDYEGSRDECYYQKLKDFVILKKPLSASEIKNILGRKIVFLRTMTGIDDGYKLLENI